MNNEYPDWSIANLRGVVLGVLIIIVLAAAGIVGFSFAFRGHAQF